MNIKDRMKKLQPIFCAALVCAFCITLGIEACSPKPYTVPQRELRVYDVVVYGGTPGGVAAAVAAARQGVSVALLVQEQRVGGMVSSGLGASDVGDVKVVGGFAAEFFDAVGRHYQKAEPVYRFEPHVAEEVFSRKLADAGVLIYRDSPVHRVEKSGNRVVSLRTLRGELVRGKVFIDASYEGDLMARAGVSYTFGREGREVYRESLAGFQTENRRHIFPTPVIAVDAAGQPLPGVSREGWAEVGTGDKKIPAYNFRLCLSKNPDNQAPIEQPENYRPEVYELLARHIAVRPGIRLGDLMYFFPLPNSKVDINNRGPVSTNLIGGSWEYPEASYKRRREIWQEHKDYIQGMLYFLLTDVRVPQRLRKDLSAWGYCRDEFTESENWPPQLYVREARRMVGDFVLTERDVRSDIRKQDAVGMGSMPIESHHVQRLLTDRGTAANEGAVVLRVPPYEIPYRVMLPKRTEAANLLNPVTVSASHVAYSSLRMEPVYMILGHSAGLAAVQALRSGSDVQDVDVAVLQQALKAQGQVLQHP